MDIRRLRFFITIVDNGSITRAADVLHIAQPALSQHVATLEAHFGKKLLIRAQQGVSMTDAGKVLYRHAQTVLRQIAQAEADVLSAGELLTGPVSVGLVPFSSAGTISVDLITEARARYPGILLQVTESVSQPYSQMLMNGRLEMALMHGTGPIKGIKFEKMLREEFFLVLPEDLATNLGGETVAVAQLEPLPFLLPPPYNFVRRAIDMAFLRRRIKLRVVAEIDSVRTLSRAVHAGIGATIMPRAIADRIALEGDSIVIKKVTNPVIGEVLSLCTAEHFPLSEPATAIRDLTAELTKRLLAPKNDSLVSA
ncbi:LysR substrate-binding domain-containing protein [Chelativorans sp. SCAU2101]|jgi:Transcriptional regulator|uniref:LysR substrate-binding domain-containing protein n=1 Tax=Chelativorans petroleitrophicus TaxID=2975484 RepID=A0A9X2XAY0_9HYPH|nr:LysR substrate-binding domain-containing protein [Chelativorans petroleitrophicus]MCT8991983.1 LysR substrate-binding domain-containing protein [Chelativorans petroleitrophicus]